MKKLLCILSCFFIMSSCTTIKYFEYATNIDYSKYYNTDFFITESNSVSFDYIPISSVSVEIVSGDIVAGERPPMIIKENVYNPEWGKYKQGIYKEADYSDVLSKIVDECKKYKANGVINLKFITKRGEYGKVLSIYASGMAINRK